MSALGAGGPACAEALRSNVGYRVGAAGQYAGNGIECGRAMRPVCTGGPHPPPCPRGRATTAVRKETGLPCALCESGRGENI
ncbi:MAG: hypothetical protein NC131_09155 [Roseburia sp.]|nr:hypothetical protein [Roseburia sp.]